MFKRKYPLFRMKLFKTDGRDCVTSIGLVLIYHLTQIRYIALSYQKQKSAINKQRRKQKQCGCDGIIGQSICNAQAAIKQSIGL